MADTDTELGALVPSDDEPFTPSDELDEIEARLDDPSLFGEDVQQEEVVLDTAPQVYSLGRSWAFDFSAGRFVPDSSRARAPLGITGMETLEQWVEMALYTPRGALPIHSDDYGMEDPDGIIGSPYTAATTAVLRRQIEEALTFHPKILGIEDFEANPDDDALDVSFRLRLDNNDLVPFSTRLQ